MINSSNIKLSSFDFIQIMNERFENNIDIELTVTGGSMVPFLVEKRDKVILEKYKGVAKKGDIIFYQRKNGACVLHRVYKADKTGIFFIGDSQNFIEGPLSYDCILAECNRVQRKGKTVTKNSFTWFYFRYVWMRIIPLRIPVIRFISKFKQ